MPFFFICIWFFHPSSLFPLTFPPKKEYICLLDNEMEELYFKLAPTAAVEIYDTYFKASETQSCVYYVCCLPWKLMLVGLGLFPICCFVFIFYGAVCK